MLSFFSIAIFLFWLIYSLEQQDKTRKPLFSRDKIKVSCQVYYVTSLLAMLQFKWPNFYRSKLKSLVRNFISFHDVSGSFCRAKAVSVFDVVLSMKRHSIQLLSTCLPHVRILVAIIWFVSYFISVVIKYTTFCWEWSGCSWFILAEHT